MRRRIIDTVPDLATRKTLLGGLVDDDSFARFSTEGADAWRAQAEEAIDSCIAGS